MGVNEKVSNFFRVMAHLVGAILVGTIIGLMADVWRAPDMLYRAHETVPPLIGFQLGPAVYDAALHRRQRHRVVSQMLVGLGLGLVPGFPCWEKEHTRSFRPADYLSGHTLPPLC